MSHHTIIIATTEINNNNISNFHSVLKMIIDYKELVSSCCVFTEEGLHLEASKKPSNLVLGMIWTNK